MPSREWHGHTARSHKKVTQQDGNAKKDKYTAVKQTKDFFVTSELRRLKYDDNVFCRAFLLYFEKKRFHGIQYDMT